MMQLYDNNYYNVRRIIQTRFRRETSLHIFDGAGVTYNGTHVRHKSLYYLDHT